MGMALSGLCCAADCAVCLACKSICACCPSSSKSAPSPDAGRWGSLWVMIFAIVGSLFLQYYAALHFNYSILDEGCDDTACRGAALVYRVSCCTALLFLVNGVVAYVHPPAHDRFWFAKVLAWLAILGISLAVPSAVFDLRGFAWLARIGAFAFVVVQQVLLIDLAYHVNDTLVTLADSGEVSLWCGVPSPLVALITAACGLFSVAVAGTALLFVYFNMNCAGPFIILVVTCFGVVIATLCQLFASKDSNLLTSSVVASYATYLAAAALAANPVDKCNAVSATGKDWLSIALGIGFTAIALLYTCYSASSQVAYLKDGRGAASAAPGGAMMTRVLAAAMPEGERVYGAEAANEAGAQPDDAPQKTRFDVVAFNAVMALMAMMVSMVLTNWGSIPKARGAQTPQAGNVAMWMQAAAQWTALLLYVWTSVAPALCPDRDFS
ncbi:serine incorporator/TMS membrane protein [Pelagophyceae sp. CCMP2097]|nr:serine incorporator/TMS membrane protein [Pelagophyceae sp. CCMP2097]|mmetsp:Transcript_22361/g.75650  ORF Transcript_22361/g.75650 Transcript_22361/m.75650 type:complete len:439 (-) Transcript_22361:43-1359(-)